METELKWCTYGAFGKEVPSFIGQLVDQMGNTGKIRYAEKQMYPLQYWDMDYVMVHESLEDAIRFLIEKHPDETIHTVKEYLPFKTAKENIDWNKLTN